MSAQLISLFCFGVLVILSVLPGIVRAKEFRENQRNKTEGLPRLAPIVVESRNWHRTG